MKAHIVQPEDIAYIWEQVAPLLDRVKEHSEGELETWIRDKNLTDKQSEEIRELKQHYYFDMRNKQVEIETLKNQINGGHNG